MKLESTNLIWSRVVLDVVALGLLLTTTLTSVDHIYHSVIFPCPYILTLLTAGPTNRWTLTVPMIPLLLLQAIRYVPALHPATRMWPSVLIMSLSLVLILLSAVLSVFFPPLNLPDVKGPYQVGVVDFHIPVAKAEPDTSNKSPKKSAWPVERPSHIAVRLLYPTNDKSGWGLGYLKSGVAKDYCRQTMLFGAPPMLKKFDWFLHYWRLIRLPVIQHAKLLTASESSVNKQLPVVIYSHGLGGSMETYSYQTMTLASQGHIVLSINHSDGSAPAIQLSDDSIRLFDHDVSKTDDYDLYVRRRRAQADHRATEMIAAAEALLALQEGDNVDLLKAGVSLRDRLDTDNCTFMGHSFGGATALSAAARRPDLVQQIVAHEPAVDWMTDDGRHSLFAKRVMKGLKHSYSGGTGGYELEDAGRDDKASIVHDLELLVMYSKEWEDKNWGESHIVKELYSQGRLGRQGGASHFKVVEDSHHMEFSDVAMLTPTWLARASGQLGTRSPTDTAAEIDQFTISWLERVRNQRTAASQ